MKKTYLLLPVFLVLVNFNYALSQVNKVEPAFWWAGMKNSSLQLMVYGDNIGFHDVSTDNKEVLVKSVTRPENPNYLFIDLCLENVTGPGSFDIFFSRNDVITDQYSYELKKRDEGSAGRTGFDNSDVLYLIMPDRFANGDTTNDIADGMLEKPDRSNPNGRYGGDIQGIMDNLDYLSDMGFTAIWLNPLLENNMHRTSYHGYSTTDFYRVDPRFGTNEEYRELSLKAKEKGIKMVMDMIFNHCGSEHWWMNDLPSPDWINNHPGFFTTTHRKSVNMDPYVSDYDKSRMLDGWFVPSMPDLNQRNPFLSEYLIQNSIWWIEFAGLDGIRMDTYPYPDKEMMAEWNRRVLDEYPDFNIVGEEWSTNPLIVSYWQKGQTNRDGYDGYLPSVMDFPLQEALSQAFSSDNSGNNGLIKLYEALASDFIYPDPDNLLVFADNHDMSRFYMQVGEDYGLYTLGMAYILTTRGIPQVFYGSEVLMTHRESNSHGHIRKEFPGGWDDHEKNALTGEGLTVQEKAAQEFFRKILNWRKSAGVIHHGKLTHFVPGNGVYVFFRYDENDTVMVVLNSNNEVYNLETERFKEVIDNYTYGDEVLSGKRLMLDKYIELPPKTPLIIELVHE